MTDVFDDRRRKMVEHQLMGRDITDPAVLQAMGAVPRERFVDPHQEAYAYADGPLPIGEGQTISQPYVVALMTQALELGGEDRVLEVGTGSGYAAAVLAEIAQEVYTIERHDRLAAEAEDRLEQLGYENVTVICGDGSLGWPQAAPYDAIVVAAGGPEVPESLREQLEIGGRLVIPVGPRRTQRLIRLRRISEPDFREEELGPVGFVPLIGEEGWDGQGRKRMRRRRSR